MLLVWQTSDQQIVISDADFEATRQEDIVNGGAAFHACMLGNFFLKRQVPST